MNPVFRPMREDEFEPWFKWAVEEYARDEARSHAIQLKSAREQTRDELHRLLPDGLATEGHGLLIAQDASTGERVGYLWFAPRETEAGAVLWLYDIYVDEPARGRGFGKALMRHLEEEAHALGLCRIELNVDGNNEWAQRMYSSLGYREMARQMFKTLDPPEETVPQTSSDD